jgi:N-acetylmuramoyl-L-alanine amidase
MMPAFAPDTTLPVTVHASPSFDDRKAPADMLLLHYSGMPTAREALERLVDPASKVSCHYLVDEDGSVVQMVPEALRAWHAGLASWEDETDINSLSVGIEIVNPGHEYGYRAFPEAQIAAVIALGQDICARNAIPRERVLGHSDVAPRRKEDPGELFPWERLAASGLGLWVPPAPLDSEGFSFSEGDRGDPVEELQSRLALLGYGVEISGLFDSGTRSVVAAFQRHYRPARIDGTADPSTVETLGQLLAALPVRAG